MGVCEKLYKKGYTDKQVAEILDVKEQTINNWKIAHPIFFESLKDWKLEADRKVEEALYQRACGYESYDYKVVSDGGNMGSHVEEVKKHVPADPTSMIFWLKNRQPDQWREKNHVEFDYKNAPTELLKDLAKRAIDELENENKN